MRGKPWEVMLTVDVGASVSSVSYGVHGERIVTSSNRSSCLLFRADTGEKVLSFDGHDGNIRGASFSPSGNLVVSFGEGGEARIWRADNGGPVSKLRGHTGSVLSAAFSPDGAKIATSGEDGMVMVWDAKTGACDKEFGAFGSAATSVTFSPDGLQLLTAGWEDRTAVVWDLASGARVATLRGHRHNVYTAVFSPRSLSEYSGLTVARDSAAGLPRGSGCSDASEIRPGHDRRVTGARQPPRPSRLKRSRPASRSATASAGCASGRSDATRTARRPAPAAETA